MANGVGFADLTYQFGIKERDLRRHEALHSTMQPTIDPLMILRGMRYVHEQSEKIMIEEINWTNLEKSKVTDRKLKVLRSHMEVLRQFSALVNAPKHLDPNVVLPRWHQTILKLSEKLKDIPGAIEALGEWAKEESPPDTGALVKSNEVQKLLQDEQKDPSFKREEKHHQWHFCPDCTKRFGCNESGCVEVYQRCGDCRRKHVLKSGEEQFQGALDDK